MDGLVDLNALLGPVVYLLTLDGEVVYVGQSRTPLLRLYTHYASYRAKKKGRKLPYRFSSKGFKFNGIKLRPCKLEEMSAVEKALIQLYHPKHNVCLKNNKVTVPILLNIGGVAITLNSIDPPKPKPTFTIERRV